MGCGAGGRAAPGYLVRAGAPFPEMAALYDHIRTASVVKREVPVAVGDIVRRSPMRCGSKFLSKEGTRGPTDDRRAATRAAPLVGATRPPSAVKTDAAPSTSRYL
jgi:hypothetical protein